MKHLLLLSVFALAVILLVAWLVSALRGEELGKPAPNTATKGPVNRTNRVDRTMTDPNLKLINLFIGYGGLAGTLDGVTCEIDNCEVDVNDVCRSLEMIGAGSVAQILKEAYEYAHRHRDEPAEKYLAAMNDFGNQVLVAPGVETLHEAYRTNGASLDRYR